MTVGLEARAIVTVISRALLDQVELETLDVGFVAECSAALDASSRLMMMSIDIVDRHELGLSKKGGVSPARESAA
jgi:hypothetical protein